MSEESTYEQGNAVFVPARVAFRGKIVAIFLLLNWALMGWFTIRAPSGWFTALTLFLGLICLIAGLSQWRAAQNAKRAPMVRWNDDHFAFRPYSRLVWVELPWRRLRNASTKRVRRDRPSGDHVEVSIEEKRILFLGWPDGAEDGEVRADDALAPRPVLGLAGFSDQDQARILALLRRRILKRS